LTLSIDADDVLFPMYIKQALLEQPELVPADETDAYVKLLQHLTNGLGLHLTMQEDAVALEAQVAGGSFFDLAVYNAEDIICLTSTLLPDCALSESVNPAADRETMLSTLEKLNGESIKDSIRASVDAWLSNITPTVSTGEFSGDAYEGGTACTTWMLTDSDIAALISSAATDEVRRSISSVCEALDTDAEVFLSKFDEKNAAVADADTYMYILRMVEDAAGELRGLSLTVIEDVEQVATISIGVTKKEVTLVLGLGLDEQNYWWRSTAKKNQRNNITFFSGTSQEWMADKQQSFPYVCTANAPLTAFEWHCNVTKSGNRYLWDASVYEDNDQPNYRYLFSSSGSYIPRSKQLDGSISWGDSPYIPLTLKISFGPAEAIAPLPPALKICSLSAPEDAQLREELLNKCSATLMARLIKLLPLDVLMMINQMSMPK